MSELEYVVHRGGCHCGSVRIEVDAPAQIVAYECNCSMCERTGFWHLIVPANRLRLLSGHEYLTSYRFNTRVANHLFCERCGVRCYYVPRSNPDGFSVNVRCLEQVTIAGIELRPFDGRDWEVNAAALAHLSKEK